MAATTWWHLSSSLPVNTSTFGVIIRAGVFYFMLFIINKRHNIREVNYSVIGKGLQLLSANGGRLKINLLLFADDTALVADSEKKLCGLVSVFGRVCEIRKLRVNVGKSKVIRCSRYGNGSRVRVLLNGEPLEEVDCFKYTWCRKWQLLEDVKRMCYTE